MQKNFVNPEMTIQKVEVEDVITTSVEVVPTTPKEEM